MTKTAKDGRLVVGVDIGATKVALMATDIVTGDNLGQHWFPTPATAGPERMIAEICHAIERLVAETGQARECLGAIGLAVPGQVDVDAGQVIFAGNLDGWQDVPLRDIVRQRLAVPAYIDQDANVAALGERWRGAAKGLHDFVFLSLGTGVGAGVVINGRLHRGAHHAAGEVGNFLMGRQYLGRDRQGHGNLERLIGSPTIRATARRQTGRELKPKHVLTEARRDPRLAPQAERVADNLAIAVVNIAALLDPEAIVFGGGTAAAGADLLDRVSGRVARELAAPPTLMLSALGEDAQLHGAVFGALWQLNPELALEEGPWETLADEPVESTTGRIPHPRR